MDVAQPAVVLELLHPFARLVEVAAELARIDKFVSATEADQRTGAMLDAIGVARGLESGFNLGTIEHSPPPPPAPAQTPIHLHSGMQPPRKVVDVHPLYPALAQSARKEGVVILEAVIDARGHVASVRVLRSIPLPDQAAVEAVRQWVFTPTLLNDVPVPVVMTVTVNFTLQDR